MSQSIDNTLAVHPGEILREDCHEPQSLSVSALARALGKPAICKYEK